MTPRQEFEQFIQDMDCQLASNDRLTLSRIENRYESLAVELAWQAWQYQERAISCAHCGAAFEKEG